MAPVKYSIGRLTDLLTDAAKTKYAKDLLCARDVCDKLAEAVPPPKEGRSATYNTLALLMSVNVIITPDSPPGHFRLVRHDNCKVNDPWTEIDSTDGGGIVYVAPPASPPPLTVSHSECSILEEGVLE